jgi:acyl phosphate:glycerol-3-phosphate acyltransferase
LILKIEMSISMSSIENMIAILCAYLIGSISSAIIVCKIMGLPDPRTEGSKNPGATNVLRIGGKKAAFITLLGDALKGLIPVLIAKWYGFSDSTIALVAFAAFLGHLFPVFFNFEGGKGVATFIGCLLALSLPTACGWIATWLIVAFIFRYSSLAALTASFLVPFYMAYFEPIPVYILIVSLMAFILFIRHRQNMINLWRGKEKRIGKK